ncbi:MAG: type 4a pilus biogenesis protein PilO [bacterium]|nr:type 4a pilus biogenesis protein PilO [bacterium]
MRQSTKRLFSMLLALALIVAAFVIFFNYTRATYDNIKVIRGEKASREKFIEDQQQAISNVRKLLESYRGEVDFQNAISASFSDSPNLSAAIAQISGLASQSSITLVSVTVGKSGAAPKTVSGPTSLIRPLNVIGFSIKLIGSYEKLKDFLSKLESNVRIFEVNSIGIQPLGESNQNIYSFDIQVETYYQG